MSEFTSRERTQQLLHELQVLMGIGFSAEQGALLVLRRNAADASRDAVRLFAHALDASRVMRRPTPRLSPWAIPSVLAKYPCVEDAGIEQRRAEILKGCEGMKKPAGLKPRTPPSFSF